MIIYITTNLINGKKYIGKDEKNNPKYIGSGNLFKSAIKKYGKENFQKEILATAFDKEDLCELETYYIEYYCAQTSDMFYNTAPGGNGGKLCKEYKYREKIVLEINPISFDIIKKYNSLKEASIENNLNYKTLSAVCNNSKTNIKGRLFVLEENYDKEKLKVTRLPHRQKYITLSYKTGIFYYTLEELWKCEFEQFKTLSSFLNYTFKHKEEFKDKFITERL